MDKATTATKGRTVTSTALVEVKLALEVAEVDAVERHVVPGRLMLVALRKWAPTRPVPEGFAVEPAVLARFTGSRAVAVEGFFVDAHGISTPGPNTPRGFFGTDGMIGNPPGGVYLAPAEAHAAIVAAVEAGTFTIGEVETFCRDARAHKVLQAGVVATVTSWLAGLPNPGGFYSAAIKANLPPGFGGRASSPADFAELLDFHAARLTVGELLALPEEVKALA